MEQTNRVGTKHDFSVAGAGWRRLLLASAAAVIAPLCPAGAMAQTAARAEQATGVQEIVVTGSRVVRNGFESPTPTTVLGAEALQAAATVTVADTLNQLPAFTGSSTSHTNNVSGSTGLVGVNTLNLRGLGNNRTLVLMDGQRGAGSDGNGALDINVIPSGLIKRVDVVTGGASAAYGSDAVSGVVNFILDRDYTGVKLNAEHSVTTYGDDQQYKGTATAGLSFAGGRGHILAYGEYFHLAGIDGRDRPWEHGGYQTVTNPLYGTAAGLSTSVPQYLLLGSVGLSDAAPGGIITAGPLRGTAFGPGGAPFQLNYGTIVAGGQMIGGDWKWTNIDDITNQDVRQTAERLFGRVSFELTEALSVYAGAQYSRTDSYNTNGSVQFQRANLSVSPTNPYLPASVRARAAALGVTAPMTFGTTTYDIGTPKVATERTFTRYNVGADGRFDAMGTTWTFNAHYQHSQMEVQNRVYNVIITANLRQALDAVTDLATGQIVCRNPANGCVPINLFGTGVASPASIAWVTGTSSGSQFIKQSSGEASVSGEPFSTWAGPVSVAVGASWRKDSSSGDSSALDKARAFFFGNFAVDNVSQSVREAFAETVVPLAKDQTWAKSLEVNGAVRATDYSLAGKVTTWKLGASYSPMDDLRFRVTRSRDIRAPALTEVSLASRSTSGGVVDPLRGNAFTTVLVLTQGNPGLRPETADTFGVGAVVSPRMVPRLTMSADYYDIDLTGAIQAISAQQEVTECSNGNRPDLCEFIVRGAPAGSFPVGPITSVRVSPVNIAQLRAKGIDFEAAYSIPLDDWSGSLDIRALATHVIAFNSTNLSGVNKSGGSISAPDWRYNASLTLALPRDQIRLTWRAISESTINANWITCTTGCPVATVLNPTAAYNKVKASHIFDLSLNHRFEVAGAKSQVYFVVQNLLNRPPPAIPGQVLTPGFFQGAINAPIYDRIGRYFHAGVRVDF